MAMRKLFVHCGVHRTGTTLIQSYLAKNRDAFAKAGIIYPFDEESHQFLVGKIRRGELDPKALVELIGSIPASDGASILLSGEDFCGIESRDWLKALASSFETRVIFYMRRQDLWMNSWYNQNIKWPWDRRTDHLSPHEFLELISEYFWLDYAKTLDRFSASVGRENLLLGVVEKAQVRDVVPDFLKKIGIEPESAPAIENGKSNESIPPLATEVLRHLDLLSLQPRERYQLICKITELTNRIAPHQSMMVFSPDERRAILARFVASNAAVARNYFGRADGRLFLDPDISDSDPYTHAELPPPDELLRAVVAPLLRSTIGPAAMMSAQAEPPPTPAPAGFHPVVRASREAAGGSWDLAGSALTYLETIRPFESVAEVGCGTAEWLHVAAAKGAKRIRGYDFAGLDLRARNLKACDFVETDFSTPLVAESRFDLAVAVGVAERIPRDRAETFVESLANLSDWIVFCAAVPYQGGNHILNENWLEYWATRFLARDYLCYDILRPKFWADTKLPSYFRQSAVLFVKAGSRTPLEAQGFTPTATPVTMIHPEHYLKAASIPARAMPSVLRNLENYLALGRSKGV